MKIVVDFRELAVFLFAFGLGAFIVSLTSIEARIIGMVGVILLSLLLSSSSYSIQKKK